jgi:hypothetical protein
MELEAPQKVAEQTYRVNISVEANITVEYTSGETGTHTTPPDTTDEIQAFLRVLGPIYEDYSKRWFHMDMSVFAFLRRLVHHWDFAQQEPYTGSTLPVQVRQVWCPDHLEVLPRTIQLHWRLVGVSYETERASGLNGGGVAAQAQAQAPLEEVSLESVMDGTGPATTPGFPEMDLRISGVREVALRKVREARLRAAVAKWHANELMVRYYERYGTTELLDGDSVLSSDDEQPPENKK